LRHLTLKYINLTFSYIDLTFVHIVIFISYRLLNKHLASNTGEDVSLVLKSVLLSHSPDKSNVVCISFVYVNISNVLLISSIL
jgi:hypothetical protein